MSDDELDAAALSSLAGRRFPRLAAEAAVPREPGLYAFYGDAAAWSALGLSPAFDDQPLYVGKAERSLHGRDVGGHFAAGRTGSSTLRRSLASLLAAELALVAVPRNAERRDSTATFALDEAGEQRLSAWMEDRLELAFWVRPDGTELSEVETRVVLALRPPLNIDKVGEPRPRLRAARRRMVEQARGGVASVSPPVSSLPLRPSTAQALAGDEPFEGLDATVIDFWRFAMSDLRMNNVRGLLAEFLVASAVGSRAIRVEWDAFDVKAPDGTRIEVKATGYLQAWAQSKLSTPTFRVAPAYGWDNETETWSSGQELHADVYVFCLQTARSHDEYDPFALDQWRFYVLDQATVAARTSLSMGLSTLKRLAGEPVIHADLGRAIALAAGRS